MISSIDALLLNGVNPPGSVHTWVPGVDLAELDAEIKRLRTVSDLSPTEIAAELGISREKVQRRICYMIKIGELQGQHQGRRRAGGRRRGIRGGL